MFYPFSLAVCIFLFLLEIVAVFMIENCGESPKKYFKFETID